MFPSLPDHHHEVHAFLVKVTELNFEYSCVVMLQHNIQCIYVMFGVVGGGGIPPPHTQKKSATRFLGVDD
jgi:hypothetical protein